MRTEVETEILPLQRCWDTVKSCHLWPKKLASPGAGDAASVAKNCMETFQGHDILSVQFRKTSWCCLRANSLLHTLHRRQMGLLSSECDLGCQVWLGEMDMILGHGCGLGMGNKMLSWVMVCWCALMWWYNLKWQVYDLGWHKLCPDHCGGTMLLSGDLAICAKKCQSPVVLILYTKFIQNMSYKQNYKISWGKAKKKKKLFAVLSQANICYLQHQKHDPHKKNLPG